MSSLWHLLGRPTALLIGSLVIFLSSRPASRPRSAGPYGRPLDYWITQLDREPALRDPRTAQALAAAPESALPALCQRLTLRDGPVRRSLFHLAETFPILRLPTSSAETRRRAAAEVLAGYGDAARPAAGALTAALRLAQEARTIITVQKALRSIGPEAIPSLLPVCLDPQTRVRITGLGTLAEVLRAQGVPHAWASDLALAVGSQLPEPDPQLVRAATENLFLLGPAAEPCLPAILQNVAGHPAIEVRRLSIAAIGEIARQPDRCVPALTRALADADLKVRTAAAKALGRFGPEAASAAEALAAAATNSSHPYFLRLAATVSLGRVGPGAGETAAELLANLQAPQAIVRAATATALGRIASGPSVSVPALVAALGDEDAYVRQNASRAIAAFGPAASAHPQTLRALIVALTDPMESVRIGAVEALGSLGPAAQPAVPHLVAARNNNQSVMTRPVLEALARIHGDPTVPAP